MKIISFLAVLMAVLPGTDAAADTVEVYNPLISVVERRAVDESRAESGTVQSSTVEKVNGSVHVIGPQPPISCVLSVSPATVRHGDVMDIEVAFYPCYDRGERTEVVTVKWPSTYEGYDTSFKMMRSFPKPDTCVSKSIERVAVPLAETVLGVATVDLSIKGVCTASTTIMVQ